jgi:methyltransferase (TIGR00027 family)
LYSYLNARTSWLDSICERALEDNIPQILLLGAGYDSRSYRFRERIKEARRYELDSPPTQFRKRDILTRTQVTVPEQVTFVPVSFNVERIADTLFKAGFD